MSPSSLWCRLRVRAFCACLALVLAGIGVVVLGDSDARRDVASTFVNPDAPEAQRALRVAKVQRDRLRSPQARRQREPSRIDGDFSIWNPRS